MSIKQTKLIVNSSFIAQEDRRPRSWRGSPSLTLDYRPKAPLGYRPKATLGYRPKATQGYRPATDCRLRAGYIIKQNQHILFSATQNEETFHTATITSTDRKRENPGNTFRPSVPRQLLSFCVCVLVNKSSFEPFTRLDLVLES